MRTRAERRLADARPAIRIGGNNHEQEAILEACAGRARPLFAGRARGITVYLSGQIGLDPATGNLVDGVEAQTHQVFKNLRAVAQAAGGELDDIVKLTLHAGRSRRLRAR